MKLHQSLLVHLIFLVVASAQDRGQSVSFEGLRTFAESEARALIEPQLETIDEQGPSTARADDAAFFLEREMRERGFEDARVTWELPSPTRVVLQIHEGRRLILTGVRSIGNDALSDEALFELMTADTRQRLELSLNDRIPYVVKDVSAGRDHVKDFYELLGYVAATVTLLEPEIDPNPPGDRAAVKLVIDEGALYKLGAVQLGPPPDPSLEEEFEKVRQDYVDQHFTPSIASQVAARLRQIVKEAGYFEPEIEVTAMDPVDLGKFKSVDLLTQASYGKRFFVRSIQLQGNDLVSDRYFRRSLEGLVGSPYDPSAANERVASMLETGNFTRVTTEPQITDQESGALQLEVDVEDLDRGKAAS